MGEPLRVDELREATRTITDEEHEEIIAEMVAEGILDEDGNVLKRFPEPPWLAEDNGHVKNGAAPGKPKKRTGRTRKRS